MKQVSHWYGNVYYMYVCAFAQMCTCIQFFSNHIPKEFIKSYVGECVMMSMCLCPVKLTSSMCVCARTGMWVSMYVMKALFSPGL